MQTLSQVERPILFSGPMVRATMREVDPKTQTRRVVKLPRWVAKHNTIIQPEGDGFRVVTQADESGAILADQIIHCPYGKHGDRLWVRETWSSPESNLKLPGRIAYNADGEAGAFLGDGGGGYIWLHHGRIIEAEGYRECFPKNGSQTYGLKKYGGRWRPSIHMPRWASRISLEIVKVRVERVQDISEEDAIAEGMEQQFRLSVMQNGVRDYKIPLSYRGGFANTWNEINSKRGFGWDKNPWVWVISFKQVCGAGAALRSAEPGPEEGREFLG
jgi:hypothetical protein